MLVDATGLAPRDAIGWDHIAPRQGELEPGVIVLLHTGWDADRDGPSYFDHPYLDGDACAELLARGVRTIGIDAINLDETPAGELDRAAFRCHDAISRAEDKVWKAFVGIWIASLIAFPVVAISGGKTASTVVAVVMLGSALVVGMFCMGLMLLVALIAATAAGGALVGFALRPLHLPVWAFPGLAVAGTWAWAALQRRQPAHASSSAPTA